MIHTVIQKKCTEGSFDKNVSFDQRQAESIKIRAKYVDRVPVIVEESKSGDIGLLKSKYLVPNDLVVSMFMATLRKNIKLQPDENIFIFCNNSIPSASMTMIDLYNSKKSDDGFLKMTISKESTFGSSYC